MLKTFIFFKLSPTLYHPPTRDHTIEPLDPQPHYRSRPSQSQNEQIHHQRNCSGGYCTVQVANSSSKVTDAKITTTQHRNRNRIFGLDKKGKKGYREINAYR